MTPLVLGHRGAPREAPENTLASFAAARRAGADGIELDVHLTADGVLVVHHDATLSGFGPLAEHRLAEIRTAGADLPTLPEALDECTGMLVNVELKDARTECADALAAVLRARRRRDRVVVSSFALAAIGRVRAHDPAVRTGLLVGGLADPLVALDEARQHGHAALHPFVGSLGGEQLTAVVRRARALGLGLAVWTVDDDREMARLARAGVDALITDLPGLARRIVDRVQGTTSVRQSGT